MAGDIRLGELGRPGPVDQKTGIGKDSGNSDYKGYLLAEFTYPILPPHKGGAMWFYSLPLHDQLCLPAEKLYADYLGAVKYGNIFSIDIGPDYNGRLRDVDVKALRQVGKLIRSKAPMPDLTVLEEKKNKTGALSFGKKATASSIWGSGFEAAKAIDGDDESRWGAAPESRNGWLEVDLGQNMEVGCAVVKELGYHRTKVFAIECREGDYWKKIFEGTTIAGKKILNFNPVTARYFRLNIKEASEVPTIEEFQLYSPGKKL